MLATAAHKDSSSLLDLARATDSETDKHSPANLDSRTHENKGDSSGIAQHRNRAKHNQRT